MITCKYRRRREGVCLSACKEERNEPSEEGFEGISIDFSRIVIALATWEEEDDKASLISFSSEINFWSGWQCEL